MTAEECPLPYLTVRAWTMRVPVFIVVSRIAFASGETVDVSRPLQVLGCNPMTADNVKELLQLEPLRMEGGFFRETYRSRWMIPPDYLPEGMRGMHSIATAIYFMITPESYSRLHRVPGSEIFHFYLGDPVLMLQLHPDGMHQTLTIGTDLESGARPQVIVRGNTWMGCKLAPGGKFALLGTTMSPGFAQSDYQGGVREELIAQYPDAANMIQEYTRE